MIALAVICLVVAAVVVIGALVDGFSDTLTFSTFAGDFTTHPFWVFVLGAVTMLIALVGFSLLRHGTRRKVAQRREIKRLRRVEEESGTGAVPTTRRGDRDADTGAAGADDGADRTLVRERSDRDHPADAAAPDGRTGDPIDLRTSGSSSTSGVPAAPPARDPDESDPARHRHP